MASVIELKGSYQAKIRRKGQPIISKCFKRKEDAITWARGIEYHLDRGVYKDRLEAERNTLGEVMKKYLLSVTPCKKGWESETSRINAMLQDRIASFRMADLSGKIVADYRDRRLQQVASGTVRRDIGLLSSICGYAINELGIGIENPCALVKRPAGGKPRNRRFVADEESRLLAALNAENSRGQDGRYRACAHNPWLLPIAQLATLTAMRQGELLALQWRNVDLESQVAHLPDSKNGWSRDVPLSRAAVEILKRLPRPDGGEDDRVFPISRNAVKKGFARARERAGIVGLRFHDLRHEAVTRLADKLPSVVKLAAVSGHRDPRTLMRYYNPRASDLAKELD